MAVSVETLTLSIIPVPSLGLEMVERTKVAERIEGGRWEC